MRIIDVHHHVGSLEMDFDRTVEEVAARHVEMMDVNGIDQCVLLAPGTYQNPNGLADTEAVNDDIHAITETAPDRFFAALGTVEPSYGREGLVEIDRMLSDLGLDGVMWHSRWQKAFTNADIMFDLVERVAEHDGVVLLHAIADSKINSPWRVFEVIEAFPDVEFIVVDGLSGPDQSAEMRHRAQDVDNAVFDTGLCYSLLPQAELFVEEVGAEHLVLGTDFYTDRRHLEAMEVETLRRANLTEGDRRKIFHENLERVFV